MAGVRVRSQQVISVLVISTFVHLLPASSLDAGTSWITWSPDAELRHLAVDPVSGKVTEFLLIIRWVNLAEKNGNAAFCDDYDKR